MNLVNEPVLAPGELALRYWGASWRVAWWRTLGGRLFVTNQRFYFVPLIRTTSWSIPFESIAEVVVEKCPFNFTIGGPKQRLLVKGADGRTARFLVANVDDVSADLASRSTRRV